MRLLLLLVAFIVPAAALAQRPGVQAALLHKSEDLFVHAAPLGPGHLIVLTVPSSGVMKTLLKAQPVTLATDTDGDKTTVARAAVPPLRRGPFHELVAGVAMDDERLYVLTATRIFGQDSRVKSGNRLVVIGHHFRLHAFWLKDGSALMGAGYQLPLVREDASAKDPPDTKKVAETLGAGPLTLVEEGVRCRGTTVLFKERGVRSLEVKGKQFTPPPDFFEPGLGSR
jgi:hypothetical protein